MRDVQAVELPTKREWDSICRDGVSPSTDNLNEWKVDSLKIRIPIENVSIIDGGLNEVVMRVSQRTGEILDEKMETSTRSDVDGVRTAFSITREYSNGKRLETFLTILVNAKMLGGRYFEGITEKTIESVYQYIIDLRRVSFSFSDFVKAECVDIDVRMDFECEDLAIESVFKRLQENYIHRNKIDTGILLHRTRNRITGIQFNKRNTTSFLTSPFVKIYNKKADSDSDKHHLFFSHYGISVPSNIWRTEYTIKNKKHLRHLGMGNKLIEVVSTSQAVFSKGIEKTMSALLNPRQKSVENVESVNIAPRDKMMLNALATIADCGKSMEYAKRQILGGLSGSNRTKNTKYLNQLCEDYLRPIKRFNAYEQTDKILDVIGYRF